MMKIRTDFVTNSSSNSFIVAWPKKPDSVKVIKEMTGCESTVCEFLFEKTKKKSQKKDAENMYMDFVWGYPSQNLSKEEQSEWYYICDTLNYHYSDVRIQSFLSQNKNSHIRVYNFEDCGSNEELECHRGYPFKKVPRILISKH